MAVDGLCRILHTLEHTTVNQYILMEVFGQLEELKVQQIIEKQDTLVQEDLVQLIFQQQQQPCQMLQLIQVYC